MEPCGTPWFNDAKSDSFPLKLTVCFCWEDTTGTTSVHGFSLYIYLVSLPRADDPPYQTPWNSPRAPFHLPNFYPIQKANNQLS